MEAACPPMRAAILRYVEEMEAAAHDMTNLFDRA
jgi:hypothetical protein